MQRMKKISSRLVTFQKKALCVAVAAAFSQVVIANPLNPTVAAGSATFATNGNTLTVTNTPNTIINWQQFNIGQNETTRFIQQSTQSAVLNRIGGQNASQILGTLTSNGRVFLVNPNGVMFGQGAVIDVAGLVASSLNLSDANFLANKLNFSGGGFGAVTNLGNISTPLGGSVYLIGNNVTNQGVITTPQGQVLLAAGSSVSLVDTAGPELSVTLTANGNKAVNLGSIHAQGGRIDMFGALIEQAGVLKADSVEVDSAGRIVLRATDKATVSGEISAIGYAGKGGTVQVLGNEVTLTSSAKVDVSGVGAGGTALIGGDYQGKNAAIQNAQNTTIEQGATIKADALNNGNGGKVIVWADNKTVFDGYISARGGANGGDGGFVETSGHNTLAIGAGRANTLAPAGKTGTWLLDPSSYCVYGAAISDCTSTPYSTATSFLSIASLDSMLSTSDITVSTQNLGFFAFLPQGGTYVVGQYASARQNSVIDVHASHIYLNGTLDGVTNNTNITGIFSAQYGGASGIAGKDGVLDIGNSARFLTSGGSVEFSATNDIKFYANAIVSTSGPYTNTSTNALPATNSADGQSLVRMSAPVIFKMGDGTGYISAPRVQLATNKLTSSNGSTTAPDIRTDGLQVTNFYGGGAGMNTIYLGASNTSSSCFTYGGSALCITGQLSNVSGLTVSHPKIKFMASTDGGTTLGNLVINPNYVSLGSFGDQWFEASDFTLQTSTTFVATPTCPSGYGTAVYAGAINLNGSLDYNTNNRSRSFSLNGGVINLNAVGNTIRTPGSVAMYGSQVNLNGVGGFSIQAGQNIIINPTIVGTTGGDLTLTAGNNLSVIGNIQFTNPHYSIYGGSDLTLTAGNNLGLDTVSSPNVYGSSDLTAKAGNQLTLTGNINWGTGVYGGDVELRAPNFYGGARTITAEHLSIFTDHFNGTVAPTVDDMDIVTYSSTANLYLGGNPGTACLTNLCLGGANGISGGNIAYDLLLGSNKDIVVGYGATNPYGGYSISGPNPKAAFLIAGNDIVLDAKLSVYSPGYDTYAAVAGSSYTREASPSLAMFARNKLVDNVPAGYGGGIVVDPSVYGGHWILVTGNAPSTSMSYQGSATLPTDPWNVAWGSDGPHLIVDNSHDSSAIEISNSFISPIIAAAKSGNQLVRFGSSTNENVTGQITTIDQTQKILQDTVSSDQLIDPANKTEGTLTVSGELKVISGQITKKTDTAPAKDEKQEKDGKATGKDDKSAKEDDKKKVAAARQEAKASEEKKSSAELKREAQTLKSEGKKTEGEAKKAEGEAKKAEGEAKKSETETKKVEAEAKKVETEAKKAEETGKKAEVEAKKHDSDAKQAANEAKEAKTPVAKASAESKKAEAESKKAEAEGKKVEAEEKKVVAESKKSEVEHKKAETESKHKEAETKRTEAESKKAEAESKQAEAESKLALAEAKEAKTPQQKAAAEKRADEKRVEAIQKKAEANVKKEQAEAKKAEAEAKKAESEYKKTEAEAKKTEADSKRAESDAKKSESSAKKAESEGKKAEADSAKAKQEGKGGDEKKAEAKKQEAEQKKAQEEKKADSKKQEAEAKQKEAEGKKQEAEKKRAEAETKKAEAEKKQAERREEGRKSFAKAAAAAMSPERAAQMLAVRHEFKTEALKPALNILERNPAAANLPACGGGSDVCVPAKAAATQQIAQIASQLPAPRIPTVSFLPQIERKIAVVVAINNYKDGAIPPLESAIPDGDAIGKVMADNLGYDVRVIRDGSKADIVKSLNAVSREVGPNDSVTVYYAGHGYQMPDKSGKPGEGYWIPSDGSARSPDNWISNSDVSKLLSNIPAKQVMLVSDSCYSGAFTKEQKVVATSNDPQKLLANRSVVVMSSGGEEPVSDEGKDGHSIFAWSLMQTLKNVDKFETGGQLYEGIRKMVVDEFPQVPQYGAASSAGHVAGGDYLFESRKY